ncbi:MAG: glycosyl hydrolase [Armatimonadetes bacterium]|nr:glycosyl hydrolase [Armatimonadota bacterium]MDW8029636.1 glycosyl hydrolase [Armatimonadota bacterium]
MWIVAATILTMAISVLCAMTLLAQNDEKLSELFRSPPSEFRPLQIIHGFDNLGSDITTIRKRLEELKALGVGGLVVNVSFRDYMRSEEQWRIFLNGLKIAEDLGFALWLYDEEGYPSGAAGGLVLEHNSEFEAIGLVRTVGDDGKPKYEIQRMYEGTHCTENVYKKRRYINILNAEAVRSFIKITHDEYAKRVPNLSERFKAIFTDEPSLMTTYIRPPENALPAIPWVEDLPKEFLKRKGYDLTVHLESLFADVGDYQRVRCDFYDVIAQLVAERYFGQIQNWCRKFGIASSGHLLAEEKLLWHAMYYGDLMACLRRMDIQGIDMLTSDPKTIILGLSFIVPKFASSAAHLEGIYETMSETSDFVQRTGVWSGQKRRAWLPEMKATAAIQFLLGINIITSYYTHPFGDQSERNDYANYCHYVGRLGVMLKGAHHVCDVAVLYPIAGIWANFYPTNLSMYQPHPSKRLNEIDDQFIHLCRLLLQNQIDYDIVDERAIVDAKIERGSFKVAKEAYKALIVPTTDAIHLSTLRKIAEMKRQGVFVIAIGKTPEFAASRNEDNEQVRKLAKQIFNSKSWLPKPDEGLVQKLREKGFGIAIEPESPDLWVARYRRSKMQICFVVNTTTEPKTVTINLPNWKRANLWLPDSGEIQPAKSTAEKNGLKVTITVPALDSVFIVE